MSRSLRGCLVELLLLGLSVPGIALAAEQPLLNIYNWADYIAPDTLANFERETGIKVNYDIYDSSEIVDTKLMAGSTGYDIVFHSASFTARLIPVGIMQPLDKSKLDNWHNLDPRILATFEEFDPGLRYGMPYTWGTTGFSYNRRMIFQRMPDAPVNSADLVFRPEIVAHFADCGVTLLDSPTDVLPMALIYLGHDANSVQPEELRAAEELLKAIRPYVRYFSSQKMLIDLPSEEICIAMSWSGDYSVARMRAGEAGLDVDLAFDMPIEGMPAWFDAAYIPADAHHPDNAHRFLNYLLRPEVIAAVTNFVGYANANAAATPLVDERLRNDPAVYPDADVIQRLHTTRVLPPKIERLRSRSWSRVKTGMGAGAP